MNKHKSNKIKENPNTVRHLVMGQITTTQNLVAIKEVRHAGQRVKLLGTVNPAENLSATCQLMIHLFIIFRPNIFIDVDSPESEQNYKLWWCHDMEKISGLLALCDGNPPVAGGFPSQRASNAKL